MIETYHHHHHDNKLPSHHHDSKMPSHQMKTCINQETAIKNLRLAMAFVPFQKYCSSFKPLEALKKGTMFPELYSPYSRRSDGRNGGNDYE